MIWFGFVLWHINYCRLFNAKSSLYICIKYIWFGLVLFYGISTIVGYLMPNFLYTYVLSIYGLVGFGLVLCHINYYRLFNVKSFLFMHIKYIISKYILLITFLNELSFFFFVFCLFVCFVFFVVVFFFFFLHTVKWFHLFLSNSNNSTYYLVIYLPTVKCFQVFLCITNNSIKHQSFVYT